MATTKGHEGTCMGEEVRGQKTVIRSEVPAFAEKLWRAGPARQAGPCDWNRKLTEDRNRGRKTVLQKETKGTKKTEDRVERATSRSLLKTAFRDSSFQEPPY